MTIDEAIVRAREVSSTNRDNMRLNITDYEKDECKKNAEESEQIAEWMEELKAYRMVYGTSFADVYNKAIDDFSNALICDSERHSDEMIRRIAEKIKVVVE